MPFSIPKKSAGGGGGKTMRKGDVAALLKQGSAEEAEGGSDAAGPRSPSENLPPPGGNSAAAEAGGGSGASGGELRVGEKTSDGLVIRPDTKAVVAAGKDGAHPLPGKEDAEFSAFFVPFLQRIEHTPSPDRTLEMDGARLGELVTEEIAKGPRRKPFQWLDRGYKRLHEEFSDGFRRGAPPPEVHSQVNVKDLLQQRDQSENKTAHTGQNVFGNVDPIKMKQRMEEKRVEDKQAKAARRTREIETAENAAQRNIESGTAVMNDAGEAPLSAEDVKRIFNTMDSARELKQKVADLERQRDVRELRQKVADLENRQRDAARAPLTKPDQARRSSSDPLFLLLMSLTVLIFTAVLFAQYDRRNGDPNPFA